jgi:L-ribulose-5-phosphate 3-epimerase
MPALNRRSFVQLAGAAGIAAALPKAVAAAPSQKWPIELGVIIHVRAGGTAEDAIAHVHKLGLPTCQIGFSSVSAGNMAPDTPALLKAALEKYGVRATAIVELGPGKMVWDFYQGPETIGVVPPATRAARIAALKRAADLAQASGVPAVHTHCGFIPENPNDPLYPQAVAAVREIAAYSKERGLIFLCETGQETPITLLRMIRDTGQDNLFVNLDLANLILYGKGNPVDALDVIGPLVRGIHAKDGKFPTDPRYLGKEVPIGQGRVDFREVLRRLKALNYQGPMTIEREISGPQQEADIIASKTYLTKLIAET